MFLIATGTSIVALVLMWVLYFAISPKGLLLISTSSFVLGGLPLLLVIIFLEYFLINYIFKVDKKKFDLPPAKINLRFLTSLFLLFIFLLLFIMVDKVIFFLFAGISLKRLISMHTMRVIFLSGNFIVPFYIAFTGFLLAFVLQRSKFASFIKNRLLGIFLLAAIFAIAIGLRWDMAANMVESISYHSSKAEYFEKNVSKTPPGRIRSMFYLRAGQSLIACSSGLDKGEIEKGMEFLKRVEFEDYKKSMEFHKFKLIGARYLGLEEEMLNSYETLFTIYGELKASDLLSFTKDILNFAAPPFNRIMGLLKQNSELTANDEYLKAQYEFLNENMQEDNSALAKYYQALNNTAVLEKLPILTEVLKMEGEYKVKDDAYFYYIENLVKVRRKRDAYDEVIDFISIFPDSPYMQKIADLKESIKYTFISKDELSGKDELFNMGTKIDRDFYLASNLAIYKYNSDDFSMKKLFEFANDNQMIVAKIIPADKYLWIFFTGGKVELVNLITRDSKNIIAAGGGLNYVSPSVKYRNKIYIGTSKGVSIFTLEGRKTKMITSSEGLTSKKIFFLNKKHSSLYVGSEDTMIIFDVDRMEAVFKKGHMDPITKQRYSNFKFVSQTGSNIFGLGNIGLANYNTSRKMWNTKYKSGKVSLMDYTDKYLTYLSKKEGKNILNIFDIKRGKMLKRISDFQIGPPFNLLKQSGGYLFLANGERKVMKLSLNTYNMETFRAKQEGGDIINLEIYDDFLILIQPKGLQLVDLTVK